MKVFDQERNYDSEWKKRGETHVRIMKGQAELADKGKLIFETAAPFSSEHGEQWIRLYEKAIVGRNDYDEEDKSEFESGLTMIKDTWLDDNIFVIAYYIGGETILFDLENPYRLKYLINKYRGIREKVAEI